jgi:quinolinate synthase
MKMNTINNLLDCLKKETPEIYLKNSLIEEAIIPIERMLNWSL